MENRGEKHKSENQIFMDFLYFNFVFWFFLYFLILQTLEKIILRKNGANFSWNGFGLLNQMVTQVGKGSSEEKKVQQIPTSQFVMGMFKWFKIAKNKKIPWAILEGRWYTGRKIRQIWAEWAVCITWYLQNGPGNFFVFCNFESLKHPYNKLWSRNLLNFFPSELPLPTWVCGIMRFQSINDELYYEIHF